MFLSRPLTVLVAGLSLTGLVLATDYASYASTGDSVILGRINQANRTTTITNVGPGPALSLRTRAASPPLSVSSRKRIPRLNADTVDGWHAAKLINNTYRFSFLDTTNQGPDATFTLPTLPRGTYLLSVTAGMGPSFGTAADPNVAECFALDAGSSFYAEDSAAYFGGYVPLISGGDLVTLTPTSVLQIICGVQTGTFSFFSPLRVSFTNTNSVTNGPLTPKTGTSTHRNPRAAG